MAGLCVNAIRIYTLLLVQYCNKTIDIYILNTTCILIYTMIYTILFMQ